VIFPKEEGSEDMKLGLLKKEKHVGKFVNEFMEFLGTFKHETIDISLLILEAMCVK